MRKVHHELQDQNLLQPNHQVLDHQRTKANSCCHGWVKGSRQRQEISIPPYLTTGSHQRYTSYLFVRNLQQVRDSRRKRYSRKHRLDLRWKERQQRSPSGAPLPDAVLLATDLFRLCDSLLFRPPCAADDHSLDSHDTFCDYFSLRRQGVRYTGTEIHRSW